MIKKNYKVILPASFGFLVVLAIALAVIRKDEEVPTIKQPTVVSPQQNVARNWEVSREKQTTEDNLPKQSSSMLDPVLQKALGEKNFASRKELLRQWALSVPLNGVRPMIGRVGSVSDRQMRSEVYYELFARWAAEDPVNAVDLLRKMSAAGML